MNTAERIGVWVLSTLTGSGLVSLIAWWALVGRLSKIFVERDALAQLLPCAVRLPRLERVEGNEQELRHLMADHEGRLTRIEERTAGALQSLVDRLDRMAEQDEIKQENANKQTLILDRTVNTLQSVVTNVAHLEQQMRELARDVWRQGGGQHP